MKKVMNKLKIHKKLLLIIVNLNYLKEKLSKYDENDPDFNKLNSAKTLKLPKLNLVKFKLKIFTSKKRLPNCKNRSNRIC